MRQDWTIDEIIEHFTLLEDEHEFVSIQAPHNKLGKALLLKFFQHESRFPEDRSEIPPQAADYVVQQLGLSPDAFEAYKWCGRGIKDHRADIRELTGFRPITVTDQDKMRDWLLNDILPADIVLSTWKQWSMISSRNCVLNPLRKVG